MEDLSPHRKFKGALTKQPLMGQYYEHPWPEDIPNPCQVCGTPFRYGFNMRIGPNRVGRILKKAAYVSALPALFSPFLLISVVDRLRDHPLNEYAAIICILNIAMPIFFLLGSFFMPISRHVHCKKCGWQKDFPILKLPVSPPKI